MKMKVINIAHLVTSTKPTVNIDSGTDWANPFVMHSEDTRNQAIAQYRLYAEWRLTIDPLWLDPLIGMNLACWCNPKPCHGDVLLELIPSPPFG